MRLVAITTLIAVLGMIRQAPAAELFVSTAGSDAANACLSSGSPCLTVGHALTQAASGDTVKIADGVYLGNLLIDASTSLAISGGWSRDFISQDPAVNRTTLRGVPGASPFSVGNYSDVLSIEASSGEMIAVSIDGVTFARGARGLNVVAAADGSVSLAVTNSIVRSNGFGGISVVAGDTSAVNVAISGSTISRNSLTDLPPSLPRAAGIYATTSGNALLTLNLTDSLIDRNKAAPAGYSAGLAGGLGVPVTGGMLVLQIERCTISGNRATAYSPGGIFASGHGGELHVDIRECLIASNRAHYHSGGMDWNHYGDPGNTLTVTNVTFARNRSVSLGAALTIFGETATLTNVTVAQNKGHFGIWSNGQWTLRNSILWDQRPAGAPDLAAAGVVDADHNNIGLVAPDDLNDFGGNISADPLFVGGPGGFHLTESSPCIDSGTCAGAPGVDADGDPRPSGAGCDMGADEFVP